MSYKVTPNEKAPKSPRSMVVPGKRSRSTSNAASSQKVSTQNSRKRSLFTKMINGNIPSNSPSQIEGGKFEMLMSFDLSGFEESSVCFVDMASKCKSLLDADRCTLFLASEKDSTLYTFLDDDEGNDSQVSLEGGERGGVSGSVWVWFDLFVCPTNTY